MIVFICNYERTFSLIDLSERLSRNNIQSVFWIHDDVSFDIASKMEKDFLDVREISFGKCNLLVDAHVDSQISLFLAHDRFLSTTKRNKQWLLKLFLHTVNFIKNHSKYEKIVFWGEVSWAAEAVIALACELNDIDYLMPVDARFLNQRFLMVKSSSELPTQTLNIPTTTSKACLAISPGYTKVELEKISNRRLTYKRVAKVFKAIYSKKYFIILLSKLLAIIHDKTFYQLQYLTKGRFQDFVQGRNIVVFPLHIQPEASVDFLAPDCINQFHLINEILEHGFKVIVKDHPARIHEFYLLNKIKSLKNRNIYICKSNQDLFGFENLKIFVSITGTMSGQAAIRGKLGITVKKVFFNFHPNCEYVPRSLLGDYIKGKVSIREQDPSSLKLLNDEFTKKLSDMTLPGKAYGFSPGELDQIFQENVTKWLLEYVAN